uniref:alpha-L-fucosidase n=1 Tax=Acrobeloides nanus TaxID=290746 RepID=A0A914CFD2_9BILA
MSFIWKCLTALYLLVHSSSAQQYQANWSSLDSRPLPIWYDQAKFGIQAHWGVYSVPAYGDESFWFNWKELNDSNLANFVQTHYKPGTTYGDFAKQFNALDFDANYFAGLIKGSGAKYFILTAKHSDGFALWPSAVEWNWNSADVGPDRDLVDELIAQLAQTISLGGNFVLNIAIDANGRVLPVFEERLKNLGDFVTDHSDAIFSSKPWIYQSDVDSVVYTSQLNNPNNLDPYRLYNPQQQNNTVIYAFVTNWPDDNLINLTRVVPTSQTTVNLLHGGPGSYSSVPFSQTSNGILVDISDVSISSFPSSNYVTFNTFVLKIQNAASQCPVNWIQNSLNKQECLTFGNSTLGWNAANSQCGILGPGATLTSITSAFENTEIAGLNQGCSNAYIGLYRNSSSSNWQWINGDTATYTNWGTGIL